MSTTSFQPNWVSCPGETITNLLRKRKISPQAFVNQLGLNEVNVVQLLLGEYPIDEAIACKLAEALGGTSEFWINREKHYRYELKRLAKSIEETEVHQWLKSLSHKELLRKGWVSISAGETVIDACFRFFGVQSLTEWRKKYDGAFALAAFRKSPTFTTNLVPTAIWFRRCEVLAQKIELQEWCPIMFGDALNKIRKLVRTKNPEVFFPQIRSLCASAGVAVVVEEAPSGCAASGATLFLSNGKPLIMLSLRHKTDDHFWFTFFHEAAHLIYHHGRINLDFEERGEIDQDKLESEANSFSERILIPEEAEEDFEAINFNSSQAGKQILKFAKSNDLTPGIVVGQLQFRRNLSSSRLNSYKRCFEIEQFY